ncbi:MAG TPA: SDR family NAD(P)-dependent oxidoreductase [Pseudonocardiaceae bacterium]|nr:SDR family NAD(P)-dependent oxidoreductase [Pseudonocardiaceae bacterium]
MSRVLLVTGSSRGLGRQVVAKALAAGHRVVATARHPGQLSDFVEAYPDTVRAVALDVADADAAAHAVRVAVDEFGRLDVVVNNAGYADLAAVEDITLDSFRAQLETNLLGVVTVTKAALPVLREQGSGHVVQVSSVGGRVASVGLSAYQAAKWAVGGFSEVLAQEVGPLGIKVTVLEPGGMRTDWAGSSMAIPPISPPYDATVGRAGAADPGRRVHPGRRPGQGRGRAAAGDRHGRTAVAPAPGQRRLHLRHPRRRPARRERPPLARPERVHRPRRRHRRGQGPVGPDERITRHLER